MTSLSITFNEYFAVVIIVLFAFLVFTYFLVRATKEPKKADSMLTAGDYARQIIRCIHACNSLYELDQLRTSVEAFYDMEFRTPTTREDRRKHYIALLEAYALKEKKLEKPTEVNA